MQIKDHSSLWFQSWCIELWFLLYGSNHVYQNHLKVPPPRQVQIPKPITQTQEGLLCENCDIYQAGS